MTDRRPPAIVFEPRGPAIELFEGPDGSPTVLSRYKEVLLEGARGTGKSCPATHALHAMMKAVPGLRIATLRRTLASLRESVQVTLEEKVLRYEREPLRSFILGTKTRANRTAYDYPNGSHWAFGGLDRPDAYLSSEWDGLWFEEAREISMRAVDTISGGLRNRRLPGREPWHFILFTTNPGRPASALNKRFPPGVRSSEGGSGDRIRLLSRHEDNPAADEEYLSRLRLMKGADFRRLYLGEWCGEEGLVFPEYDEPTHMLSMRLAQRGGQWALEDAGESIPLVGFVGSFDYGYRVGCLGVWGLDSKGNAYLVAEWYRTGWHRPEWTEAIRDAHAEFNLRIILADAPDNRFIDDVNRDLSRSHGAGVGQIVRRPDKRSGKYRGIQAARKALAENKVFFLSENARMREWPDDKLMQSGQPTNTTQEIPGYAFRSMEDASNETQAEVRAKEELPAPHCPDHGCFVAGTQVQTLEGCRAIEEVRAGELVWTAHGPRPALWSGRTGRSVRVGRVLLEGGLRLEGTPDHKVWTTTGWRRLDQLLVGDQAAAADLEQQPSPSPHAVRPTAEQVESMTKYVDAPPVRASSWQADTRRCGLVLARVLAPFADTRSADVFNVEVEGEHVYFASGVLVANCDTFEYFATWKWGDANPTLAGSPSVQRVPQFGSLAFIEATFPSEDPKQVRTQQLLARRRRFVGPFSSRFSTR